MFLGMIRVRCAKLRHLVFTFGLTQTMTHPRGVLWDLKSE